MAIGLVIRLQGVGSDKYDAVMKEAGMEGASAQWPEGLLSHIAGPAGRNWCVVDVWQSQVHFDKFLGTLQAAMAKVGGVPIPEISPFDIHNSYRKP
jgi:hypothetical protein